MSPHVRGRMPDGTPNPIDVHVGRRIRLRRFLLGLSQEKLADMLGMTFQNVQKYERGAIRIGASRLWDIALVLKCPVQYFYDEMPPAVTRVSPRNLTRAPAASIDAPDEEESRGAILTASRLLSLEPDHRRAVDSLIRALTPAQAAE